LKGNPVIAEPYLLVMLRWAGRLNIAIRMEENAVDLAA
jgi:hypothetical protein